MHQSVRDPFVPVLFQTVSLERLSENSERASFRGPKSPHEGAKWHIFGAPRYRGKRDPTRLDTFQTVSLGSPGNRGNPSSDFVETVHLHHAHAPACRHAPSVRTLMGSSVLPLS